MALARKPSEVVNEKVNVPTGYVKIIYKGPRDNMSLSRPYTTDDDGEVILGGRQVYVFDRKDENGDWYVLSSNPVHVWTLGLFKDGNGDRIFEIKAGKNHSIRKKIDALRAAYVMPDPQDGLLRNRAEVDEASLVFADMGMS